MREIKEVILGQEAVVPKYGIGRVVSFRDDFPHEYIGVKTYADNIERHFDPRNVKLIAIKGLEQ